MPSSVAPAATVNPRLKMPSLDYSVVSRDTAQMAKELTKRATAREWTSHNAGVMVVFVIVFVIAVGLIALFVSKKLAQRKAARPPKEEAPAK